MKTTTIDKTPTTRDALSELVANIEMRASAFGIFNIIDRKTFLDAKAALAEPVKNCNVGTAEEQLKRFKDFCRIISKDETCDGCPLLPQCSTLEHCILKWAQMPYEGGAK